MNVLDQVGNYNSSVGYSLALNQVLQDDGSQNWSAIKPTQNVNMNSKVIQNMGYPSATGDAVNLSYISNRYGNPCFGSVTNVGSYNPIVNTNFPVSFTRISTGFYQITCSNANISVIFVTPKQKSIFVSSDPTGRFLFDTIRFNLTDLNGNPIDSDFIFYAT